MSRISRERKSRQSGFTYLELMITLLIIGTLLALGAGSYSLARANSLDQRRKIDLEEIRSALEQYRSVNGVYPTPDAGNGLPFGTTQLDDADNVYMQVIPQDPQYPQKQYHYSESGDDYTLSTELSRAENPACQTPPGNDACGQAGSDYNCNYCIGSYGKK